MQLQTRLSSDALQPIFDTIFDEFICDCFVTDHRATGLNEGLEYQFRVIALNEAGQSEASEPSQLAIALDPIGKLQRLIMTHFAFLSEYLPSSIQCFVYRTAKQAYCL